MEKPTYLIHYASPYYDPVKAHEYYEAHKKLKGRHSTANLNDKGKAAASYVKDQLTLEKTKKIKESRNSRDSKIKTTNETAATETESETNSTKSQIEQHKRQMQSAITSIRERIKRMSSKEKAARKEALYREIDKLREKNSEARSELQAKLKEFKIDVRTKRNKDNAGHRNEHNENVKSIRKEFDDKYASELDKIRSDSSLKAEKKAKTSKKTSKKTTNDESGKEAWIAANKAEYARTHKK